MKRPKTLFKMADEQLLLPDQPVLKLPVADQSFLISSTLAKRSVVDLATNPCNKNPNHCCEMSTTIQTTASTKRSRKQRSDNWNFHTRFSEVICSVPPAIPPTIGKLAKLQATAQTRPINANSSDKVKVLLRFCPPSDMPSGDSVRAGSTSSCTVPLFIDEHNKKQLNVYDTAFRQGSAAYGLPAQKTYMFDNLYSTDDSIAEICSSILPDVLASVVRGVNACITCFGQRYEYSHTLFGADSSCQHLGLIPSAIWWLFRIINEGREQAGGKHISVRVSALEIASDSNGEEYVRDLLSSSDVTLCDSHIYGLEYQGLSDERAPNAERAAHFLDTALANRSSPLNGPRHFFFTIHLYQYHVERETETSMKGGRSCLHFVLLDQLPKSRTTSNVQPLTMSTLTTILIGLSAGQKAVPLADSKAVRVLKDRFTRDKLTRDVAKLVFLGHVSPRPEHLVDTLATVQMASKLFRSKRKRFRVNTVSTDKDRGRTSDDSSCDELRNRQLLKKDYIDRNSDPEEYSSSSEQSCETVIYVGSSNERRMLPPTPTMKCFRNDVISHNETFPHSSLVSGSLGTACLMEPSSPMGVVTSTTLPHRAIHSPNCTFTRPNTAQVANNLCQTQHSYWPTSFVGSTVQLPMAMHHRPYSGVHGNPIEQRLSLLYQNEFCPLPHCCSCSRCSHFETQSSSQPPVNNSAQYWNDGPLAATSSPLRDSSCSQEIWIDGPKSQTLLNKRGITKLHPTVTPVMNQWSVAIDNVSEAAESIAVENADGNDSKKSDHAVLRTAEWVSHVVKAVADDLNTLETDITNKDTTAATRFSTSTSRPAFVIDLQEKLAEVKLERDQELDSCLKANETVKLADDTIFFGSDFSEQWAGAETRPSSGVNSSNAEEEMASSLLRTPDGASNMCLNGENDAPADVQSLESRMKQMSDSASQSPPIAAIVPRKPNTSVSTVSELAQFPVTSEPEPATNSAKECPVKQCSQSQLPFKHIFGSFLPKLFKKRDKNNENQRSLIQGSTSTAGKPNLKTKCSVSCLVSTNLVQHRSFRSKGKSPSVVRRQPIRAQQFSTQPASGSVSGCRPCSQFTDSDSGVETCVVPKDSAISPYNKVTKPRLSTHSSSGHGSDNSSVISGGVFLPSPTITSSTATNVVETGVLPPGNQTEPTCRKAFAGSTADRLQNNHLNCLRDIPLDEGVVQLVKRHDLLGRELTNLKRQLAVQTVEPSVNSNDSGAHQRPSVQEMSRQTEELERQVAQLKSHLMMVTSFDSVFLADQPDFSKTTRTLPGPRRSKRKSFESIV